MKLKKNQCRGFASLGAILALAVGWTSAMAIENAGNINQFLGITASGSSNTTNYKSSYGDLNDENCKKLQADEDAFAIKEVEDSCVLLRNENQALPLKESERKITLFGYGCNNYSYRGTNGGPKLDANRFTSIHDAFANNGFSVNETVYGLYDSSLTEEPENSIFTAEAKSSFSFYSDVAIVILTRHGGEGFDQDQVNEHGVSDEALQPNEIEMLKMIQNSGSFKKTIVLVNSVYQLELGDLSSYGVNAVLWVGNTGYQGSKGVVNLLTGEACPNGRLADTYAADSHSSPAAANVGEFAYTDITGQEDEAKYYMVYSENIYIGYKYYETRYEDIILNQGNASSNIGTFASSGAWNYSKEVTYPFGYGLSYTTFEETLVQDSFKYDSESDSFTMDVKVKNTGSVESRHTVELYCQTPYTEFDKTEKIEKSAVQLAGFGKTESIKPGEETTITISCDRYALASYDTNLVRDGNKVGGYLLDAGNYYFSIGSDVHDALNNILAEKFDNENITSHNALVDIEGNETIGNKANTAIYTLDKQDIDSYRYSKSGEEVKNEFTGDDYACDINDFVPDTVTYFTRSDYSTFPQSAPSITLNDKLKNALNMQKHKADPNKPLSSVTYGKDAGLTLADMAGVDYDDPKWTTFIQQFSVADLAVCPSDQYSNEAVSTVRKPKNSNAEGPEGINGTYKYGNKVAALCGTSLTNLAATWDREMSKQFGDYMAEDALYCGGITLVMAPGSDLHRTPFGGRAAEYFSECSILTSEMNTPLMQSLSEKGLIGCIKHVAVNDQEIHRLGVACFLNEQTLRENNLKCFEKSITSGYVKAIMTSYNRIGCCYSGNNPVLQNTIFRQEWGFKGLTICDATQHSSYSPTSDCLINGADMFCISRRTSQIISDVNDNNDGELLEALQEANHRIFYCYAHSSLINGLTSDVEIKEEIEWWRILIYVIDGVFAAGAIAGITFYVLAMMPGRKEN